MPDLDFGGPDFGGPDFGGPDFAGLTEQARAAFRPDYADVERRARHRRTVRLAAVAVTAAALAAGGLTATNLAGGPNPEPGPTPTPVPSYVQRGEPVLPGPTYVRLTPDGWDVARPDKPLTGMFTELRAGDTDHLYIEYQDCAGSRCTRMLAASADRGRTWRKHRMPLDGSPQRGGVIAVRGTTVIASMWGGGAEARSYVASVDGGATWRAVTPRIVDALPTGWPLLPLGSGVLRAYDVATGDIALRPVGRPPRSGITHTLHGSPEGGIWQIQTEYPPLPTPRPTGPYQLRPTFHLVVSHDGGATWQRRTMPDGLIARTANSVMSVGLNNLRSVDGTTVVVADETGGRLRLRVSRDGGVTWRTGATIVPDGPLLSILPTREGPILVEAGYSAYRSVDGGATLERVGPALGARAYAVPGGYAEPTNDDNYGVWLSPDGGAWTYVPPPPLP
jgi:hypothetical protein